MPNQALRLAAAASGVPRVIAPRAAAAGELGRSALGGAREGNAIRFAAKDVSLDPQVGFIGFADREGQRYFWMQPGEMTTAKEEIWLERDDQAWGGCGGEWNVVLTRDRFVVNSRQLPYIACDAVEIDLAVDDEIFARLKELLQQVMAGCRTDLDIQD